VPGRASRFRSFTRLKAVDAASREADADREEAAPPRPRPPEPPTGPLTGDVLEMRGARTRPREWNVWELEQLARAGARQNPERSQEWAYLLVHLRQFATPDGALPREFDALVRESFGELLETSGQA
jgi:hypothetical protein